MKITLGKPAEYPRYNEFPVVGSNITIRKEFPENGGAPEWSAWMDGEWIMEARTKKALIGRIQSGE